MAVVPVGDDDVVIRPPPPLDPITDVAAAVREALRYPLSGPALETAVGPGARVTVVVEHPSLPLPGADLDPRQQALGAVLDELGQLGVPSRRQTLLVAGGLERRAEQRELDWLLQPAWARRFRGKVAIHDCESPDLRALEAPTGAPFRIAPQLLDADLVVAVTAAETVLHGGAAALLAASAADVLRAASAESLLETGGSSGWSMAVELERALAARVPVLGLSLVLDHPRASGRLRGYPDDVRATDRLARSRLRHLVNASPGSVRRIALHRLGRELRVVAAFAGPPSVAHVEALLRGVELRGARIPEPLDAIVLPVPWAAPHHPREPVNPLTAAHGALGLALRLWRDRFPLVDGGTAVLLHGFGRTFGHGPGAPYRALFHVLRDGDPDQLAQAEADAASDGRALDAYHSGSAPHPLLPYADWAACAPALRRLGRVIVAGCRDAGAARALGFVPSHSVATALEMAHGVAEGRARVGFLLAPPYPPLIGT